MIETITLLPGVTLRYHRDTRFKQNSVSFQFLRPMCREEAHLNALLPDVLHRGTRRHPDMRSLTLHKIDLYNVTTASLTNRYGDYQSCGIGFGFLDERFVPNGEQLFPEIAELLDEFLNEPLLEGNGFLPEYVETEKRNLISAIESDLNNKGAFAMNELMKNLCREDPYGVPRLGEKEAVAEVTPEQLYQHLVKIRRESPIEIFYVGSMTPEQIAAHLIPIIEKWDRHPMILPPQTGLQISGDYHETRTMEVSQGKLCLGFTTPITGHSRDYAAMMVLATVFGSGMSSKLFRNVREKLSLCYSIGASYYGAKGILAVSAGIDFDKEDQTREAIEQQLEDCREGNITQEELNAAKEALRSGLRSTHDSISAIEGYYLYSAVMGITRTHGQYLEQIERVTIEDAAAAARTLTLRGSYFLRGDA